MSNTSLGQILKQLRESRKLSLSRLANETGLAKSNLWQIEAGNAVNPSFELIKTLAKFYGLPLDYFAVPTQPSGGLNE